MKTRPRAIRLYEQNTLDQLVALMESTEPHRYQLRADIDRAITWHLDDRRKAAGDPVPTCGYSGRNSNKR